MNAPARKQTETEIRASNLGRRVVEGMRSLDQEGRKAVLDAIRADFCTSCGASTPAAICACHMEWEK